MPQIPRPGAGVGGAVRRVQAGGKFLVAPGPHHFRKGRINLIRRGEKPAAFGRQGLDPAVGRSVRLRMPHHYGRFRNGGVVSPCRGREIALREAERRAVGIGMRSGTEYFYGIHQKLLLLHRTVPGPAGGVFERALGKRPVEKRREIPKMRVKPFEARFAVGRAQGRKREKLVSIPVQKRF